MTQRRAHAPRLFVRAELGGTRLTLDAQEAHYLGHVLRLQAGDPVIAFNGRGMERLAKIETLARRHPTLALGEPVAALPESTLEITLLQALIKSDAMDLAIQKATELGVHTVCAVKTEFSVVKLDGERGARRIEHWQRIAQGACEQSGRHRPPGIELHSRLDEALARLPATAARIALDLDAGADLSSLRPSGRAVCLLSGPEGGFGPADRQLTDAAGFVRAGLGPRTLRAETASIAACVLAQAYWGDLRGSA